jgi:hypothetical protein
MRVRRFLQPARLWIVPATAAGVALGVAARVAMRVVAWQAGVSASFSFGGSLEVVLFGAMIGAPAALVYWACRRRFDLPQGSGIAAGLLLLAALAAWPPPAARSALGGTPDARPATALAFAAAFATYGLVLDLLWTRNQRGMGRAEVSTATRSP